MAVKITTLPAAGSLRLSGVGVTAGQFVSTTDIGLGRLTFSPAANANGTSYASFTFQVQDNGGTANGGVDIDQSPNTMTIDVTRVNDARAGPDTTITLLEDASVTFTTGNFGFTDPNDSPPDSLLAVRIATLPAAGSLTVNGTTATVGLYVPATTISAGQ